ncbi:hypothetical protein HZS_999 [Henneguya salminicola]|nr:hypothetical protein HZS_999 [Henneguya salminicola]
MDSIYITTSPSVTMHSDLLSKLSILNTVHENRKKLTNSMNAENEKLEQNINKCKAELESFVIVPPQTYITKLVCLVLDIQKKQLKMKTFRNKIKATTISSANINTNKLQPKGKLAHRSFCLLNPFLRSTPHPVAIPTLKPSVVESKTFDNAEKIIKSPTNRKQLILSRKPEDAVKKDTIDEISKFKKPKRNKVVEFVDSTTPKLIGKKDFNLCSPSEGFTFQMRSMFSSDSEKLEDISLGSKDSFLLRPFNYEPKSQENFFNLSLNNNLELLF